MGYYSQVAIAMRKEEFNTLKNECEPNNHDLETLLRLANVKEHSDFVTLEWNWIKWYDTFPEIRAINEFLWNLDADIPYKFIRIGEDFEDTVMLGNYGSREKYGDVVDKIDECMYLYRDVEFNDDVD